MAECSQDQSIGADNLWNLMGHMLGLGLDRQVITAPGGTKSVRLSGEARVTFDVLIYILKCFYTFFFEQWTDSKWCT